MKPKPNNKRIIPIIALIFIAAFSFANFASAQVLPPLNKAALDLAQTNKNECLKFSNLVFDTSGQTARAIWDATPNIVAGVNLGPKGGCYIVSVANTTIGTDGISAIASNIPNSYGLIEQTIRDGKGITKEQWAGALDKANEAAQKAGLPSQLVGKLLEWIFDVLVAIAGFFAAMAGGIFSLVLDQAVSGAPMPRIVGIGWAIVRDICNMFFILILIAIALATILRFESYNYKKLLRDVIIMALLVNFSQLIAVTIIGFTNFLIASLAGGMQFKQVYANMWTFINQGATGTLPFGGISTALVIGVGKLVFAYAALIAFLALAGLFVVRQVGLYVLIILSPFAYALNILPRTKNLAEEWWKNFLKYLIWGPVAIFFVKLSFAISETTDFNAYGTSGESAFAYIVLAAFLFAAVMVAQKAGMIGGEAVVNGVKGGVGFVGQRATGYLGKAINKGSARLIESHDGGPVSTWRKVAFTMMNPVATIKGYEQRSTETKHMAQELAGAGGREISEQFLTGGWRGKAKLKIPYRQFAERKEEDKFLKDYGNMKKESLMQAAVDSEGLKGIEGEARKRSIIKAAAANGYLDDLMRMKQFAKKYTGSDDVIYGAEPLNRFLFGYLGHGEQAQRFMAEDMEELGKKTKHFEYLGHAYYDNDTKSWKRGMEDKTTTTLPNEVVRDGKVYEKVKRGGATVDVEKLQAEDSWQVKYASSEFAKLGGRDRVAAAPHNFTVIRAETNPDGTFSDPGKDEIKDKMVFGYKGGEIDEFNTAMMGKMDADVNREIQHTQERTRGWLMTKDKAVPGTNGAVVIKDLDTLKQVQNLYKISPTFVKGLYTKALGVRGDETQKIDGVRFILESQVTSRDANNKVTGYSGHVEQLDRLSPATFRYDDKLAKVEI